MKTLLVLRHAKSSWDSGEARDFDRPLADRGRKDAPTMGRLLKASKVMPEFVLCSPAVRARETAALFLEAAGCKASFGYRDAIYEAPATRLFDVVGGIADDVSTALIVGHNPGFEEFLSDLCGDGRGGARIRVPTAALACVELSAARWRDVEPGTGTLGWFAIPKMLGKRFAD